MAVTGVQTCALPISNIDPNHRSCVAFCKVCSGKFTRNTPLQTTYRFGQNEGRENHVNRNWTRVNYNSDFTITIE